MAWSVIDEQEVIKWYTTDTSVSASQIAKHLGVGKGRILRILNNAGVEIRQVRHLTQKERTEILTKYYEKGYHFYDLVQEYDVCNSTIFKLIKKDPRYEEYKRKYTSLEQQEKEAIIKEYFDNHVTHSEIAKKYGKTRTWLTRLIKVTEMSDPEYAGKRKSVKEQARATRRFLPIEPEELVEEIQRTKKTQREMAEKYNVSESCIYHAIARVKGKK